MFSIEVIDGLRKLFIPLHMVSGIVLFFNGRLWESFFSSIYNLQDFFYSSTNLHLRKLWCVELYFLILSIVFIHEFCDKISNRNIPDPNEHNRQLLARLWDVAKRRGGGKCYCPCNQCRGFKRRRILISTTTKHCGEHGHAKGGTNIFHL